MVTDRPHLKGARVGAALGAVHTEVTRILGVLSQTGAERVEPEMLQQSDILLDLYGEDIRARAFVTRDDRAEMMLRPDFTVPIVQLHMATHAKRARYVYSGPVWRRQDYGSDRPREFLQAGIEIFDGDDPARADAEVLGLILEAVGDIPLSFVTGDMGLAIAAIEALETSPARRAALRRHLWRPARFQALMNRFGASQAQDPSSKSDLISAFRTGGLAKLVAGAGKPVGLRGIDEISARVARLAQEADTEPLDPEMVRNLEEILAMKDTCEGALKRLRDLWRGVPGMRAATDAFERRLDAFSARGIDPAKLAFEGSFGRTTLEYYDGFVFGATATERDDLPVIATGGRYDALTQTLGTGQSIPAVGGIIRPEPLMALKGALA